MQSHKVIFGVDIVKGSSRSREAPRYAVAALNGEPTVFSSVSRLKLLRLIRQHRPSLLAVDSITELAENRKELIAFLRRLPPEVRLVQVTGNEHQEPLTKLAKQNGFSFNPIIPDEEAMAAARLASMGVGYIVSVFEDRTLIKVSRARSPGRGGWSQNRYRRKVQGNVREKVREIESRLKGMDYELRQTEGFGGLVNGVFTVNKPRQEIGVHNSREEDVQVTVTSMEKDAIEYIPLERKRREYIIVGIDPGTTTAVSILSLSGKLLGVLSSRVASPSDVIEYIRDQGRPVVVATDVVPPPDAVERVKRAFNAVLFVPNERIQVDEKIRLASPYGYANNHERDAISAAVKAFNTYKNKFMQIEKKTPAHIDPNDVKALAIEGKSMEIALDMLTSTPTAAKTQEPAVPVQESDARLDEIREQAKKKDEQIANLQSYVSELRRDLKRFEARVDKQGRLIDRLKNAGLEQARKDKEVTIRDAEIGRLKKDVADLSRRNNELKAHVGRLKQVRVMELRGDKKPVKVVENLSKDSVLACDRKYGLKAGDVVFVRDAGGGEGAAALLIDRGIKAIIRGTYMSHLAEQRFFDARVPVIAKEEVSLGFVDDFAVIDPHRLDAAIDKWKSLAGVLEKKRSEEWFHGIIDEYKAERVRQFRNENKKKEKT